MYPKKWYLQTWVICLCFAAWQLIVPPILGIVLLIMQYKANKKLIVKYAKAEELDDCIKDKEEKAQIKEKEIKKNDDIIAALKKEIDSLSHEILVRHYNFSDYDGLTSEECKNKLSLIRQKENDMIKNDEAIVADFDNAENSKGIKKVITNNVKQLLRCFNTECDNIMMKITVKNIDSSRSKVQRSFNTINSIFATDKVAIKNELLELKLEELNLVYTYELKKQQEQEQQKAIKEQMIEEEKVRREIEKEKAKIEKDQTQFSNEVKRLMQYMQKSNNDVEKQLYVDKIKELEDKLKELEAQKETVLQREANARAGFVYVISNVGSFGDDVYKIGMTRRLEPMDRIKELSSASVPFDFDVHAMIFSNDAPALEASLHQHFAKQSMNKVNPRKEFFRVSLDAIEKYVKENYSETAEFTKTALAEEYRQSLQIA